MYDFNKTQQQLDDEKAKVADIERFRALAVNAIGLLFNVDDGLRGFERVEIIDEVVSICLDDALHRERHTRLNEQHEAAALQGDLDQCWQ
jgi:hypothetical protein